MGVKEKKIVHITWDYHFTQCSTVASQHQGPWFDHEIGLVSVQNFCKYSSRVHVGFLWFPHTSEKACQ